MSIEYNGKPLWYTAEITSVLEYAANLLEKHGITYWLSCGNLLGAVRDGKAISWDYDADAACFEKDIDQIVALTDEIKSDGYNCSAIKHRGRIHVFKIWSSTPEWHCDIWPHFLADDGILHNIHIGHFFVPLADIENMKSIQYERRTYPCPDNVEQLIVSRYGKDFRTYGECMQSSINLMKKFDPTNTDIIKFVTENLTIKE